MTPSSHQSPSTCCEYRPNEDEGGINNYEENWQFADTFRSYQTHVYVLRTRKDLGSEARENVPDPVD
jgi:hypothetical protein